MALAALACVDDPGQQKLELKVVHWWIAEGETQAMDALADVHQARHKNVEIINYDYDTATLARDQLETIMRDRSRPDTFQTNAGQDLLRWTENSGFEPLRGLADAGLGDLSTAFNKEVFAAISRTQVGARGDTLIPYAIPLNIHRINVIYYNPTEVAEDEVPETLEELQRLCDDYLEEKAERGESLTRPPPIQLGFSDEDGYGLALLLFENILIAEAQSLLERDESKTDESKMDGAMYYTRYFTGSSLPEAPILATLVRARRLFPCIEEQSTWQEALSRMADGGMFAVTGDWGKAYLKAQGKKFGQAVFPGTQGVFVFNSDTFPWPKWSSHPTETLDFLRTCLSVEGQDAFNRRKGSIPARLDVKVEPDENYDEISYQTHEEFNQPETKRVLSLSGLVSNDFIVDLQEALIRFFENQDSDVVFNRLRNLNKDSVMDVEIQ